MSNQPISDAEFKRQMDKVGSESRPFAHTGKIVGVASAVIAGALDAYGDGLKTSTICGTVVGSVMGYAAGSIADGVTQIQGSTSVALVALAGTIGFTGALSGTQLCRSLDRKTTPEEEYAIHDGLKGLPLESSEA